MPILKQSECGFIKDCPKVIFLVLLLLVLARSEPEKTNDTAVYGLIKQNHGIFSILLSIVQSIILTIMMVQCSIAPTNINPMFGPYLDVLDYWGAKNSYKILIDNEYWRLLSPILLHAGVIHLLSNISVQMYIGVLFERQWSSKIWLFIYLTSAIGGSIMSVCLKPDDISVGSSGAVMGILGGKLAEYFCLACESTKTSERRAAYQVRWEHFQASMCSAFIVMIISFFVPYVDWSAHLGGLVVGFMSGMICFSGWIKTRVYGLLWFLLGLGMAISFFVFITVYMLTKVHPTDDLIDICGYNKLNLLYYEDYECSCRLGNNSTA